MWHFEDPFLDGGHVISILANDFGLCHFLDLGQLFRSKGGREAGILEPEPVTPSDVRELAGDDACKRRSDHRSRQSELGNPS